MSVDATYPVDSGTPATGGGAGGSGLESPRTRFSFIYAMKNVSPPWLRRVVGGAVMESLGVPVETLVDRTVESLRKRFPNALSPEALGYLGRERRILRGPNEPAATYAARLLTWWDSHLTRGGPYALLTQMHAYFADAENPTIDCVSNNGVRHTVDSSGTITRGSYAGFTGDGEAPTKWARLFIFFQLPGTTIFGEDIYALTAETQALICSVPREWKAAHIDRIYIRLVPSGGIAWGYPETLVWGAPGEVWGGGLTVGYTCT
jgi:hypothetical protein